METRLQISAAAYRKLTDEELIYRFAFRQDKNAANFLFDRYGHWVLGICMRYFQDADTAKEHTQQIFIKLLDDLPKFRIENFKAWLLRVVKNHCLMQLRKTNREIQTTIFQFSDVESEADWHRKLEEEQLYQYLEEALTTLTPEQQRCIELFYLQKMTYAEIMKTTKYSYKEVKSFLQNGKRNLKLKITSLANEKK